MQSNVSSIRVSKKEIQEKGLYSISFRRNFTKNFIQITLFILTLALLLPLFNMLYQILSLGLPTMLNNFPFYFVTPSNASVLPQGAQNSIWSTLMLILTTCTFSLPIGIPAGIYLASSNGGKFTSIVRLIADVLQSAPSVILGFVIYVWWIIPRGPSGYGWIAGGLSLSFLMIPIVTRTTEEGIRTVPTAIYEASTSLGLPDWRITSSIVVRSAGSVILTGVMLAIARIAGETAPLIMTMLDSDRFGGFNTGSPSLTYKIFLYQYVSDIWTNSAWAMSLILVGMVLSISLVTRTGLLGKLWSYSTIKLMMIEFSVVVAIQVILSLSTDFALFLLVSLVLKYLIYDVLQKEDIMIKIWDNVIGKIVVLFIIIESILELIIYVMGTYNLLTYTFIDTIVSQIFSLYINNAYGILFRFSQFTVVGLGAFYFYKYYKKGLSGFDKIRLLIGFTFGLLLVRLTFFSVFLQFFDVIFVMFMIGIISRYTVLFSIKKAEILNNKVFNYLLWIISAELGIETLLYLGGYLTNYIYQINYRVSELLIILTGLYYIYYYFNVKTKGKPLNLEEIMKYLITIGFVVVSFLLTYHQNDIIMYVFLCTSLLHFFIWYLILDNGYFTKLWNNNLGKLLVYLEYLLIIVQGFLVAYNTLVNYIYQINNRLFYVLALAIILFVTAKYLYKQHSNYDRSKSFLVGLLFVNILQFVYPTLIPVNISLQYALAVAIFSQFIFGLLLKTEIVSIFLSKKDYNVVWKNIYVRIIFLFLALETLFEFVVMYSKVFVKETIPIIISLNGVLIYIILFFYFFNYVFKIDLIRKIFIRNVINYG